MINVYHCPKCSMELESTGILTIGPVSMPVFQCDSCVVRREVFGAGTGEIELAYTFAVNAAGQPVAPGEEDVLL